MRKIIIFVLAFMFVSFSVFSKPHYGDALVVSVVSVYDADTFRVNIKNWQPIVGENIPVRVLGVDAPEIRGKCMAEKQAAKKARLFTVNFIKKGNIELRNIRRGSFFRLLADVFVNGKSLAVALIESGNALPYEKRKYKGWCFK